MAPAAEPQSPPLPTHEPIRYAYGIARVERYPVEAPLSVQPVLPDHSGCTGLQRRHHVRERAAHSAHPIPKPHRYYAQRDPDERVPYYGPPFLFTQTEVRKSAVRAQRRGRSSSVRSRAEMPPPPAPFYTSGEEEDRRQQLEYFKYSEKIDKILKWASEIKHTDPEPPESLLPQDRSPEIKHARLAGLGPQTGPKELQASERANMKRMPSSLRPGPKPKTHAVEMASQVERAQMERLQPPLQPQLASKKEKKIPKILSRGERLDPSIFDMPKTPFPLHFEGNKCAGINGEVAPNSGGKKTNQGQPELHLNEAEQIPDLTKGHVRKQSDQPQLHLGDGCDGDSIRFGGAEQGFQDMLDHISREVEASEVWNARHETMMKLTSNAPAVISMARSRGVDVVYKPDDCLKTTSSGQSPNINSTVAMRAALRSEFDDGSEDREGVDGRRVEMNAIVDEILARAAKLEGQVGEKEDEP